MKKAPRSIIVFPALFLQQVYVESCVPARANIKREREKHVARLVRKHTFIVVIASNPYACIGRDY